MNTGGNAARRRHTRFRGPFGAALALAVLVMLPGCSMVTEASPPEPSGARQPADRPGTGGAGPEGRPRVPPPTTPRAVWPRPGMYPLRLADHVRGLWVVRTTLDHPDSIRAMVRRADEAGFNTLLVQVRGRGDAYYASRWEPKPEAVQAEGADFDPLALVIQEAHARGLGVHAWVNSHLVGGIGSLPSDPSHIIRARPDLLAVPRPLARELYAMDPAIPRFAQTLLTYAQEHSDVIEGMYTAPSSPEVKEHLYSIWMDLLERYDLDGLHFDYIRYPGPDFDYSAGALDRFREWVMPRISPVRQEGLERAFQADPLAYVDSLPGPWDEFRRAQITDLVERIYYGVKKRKPDVVVSAAVFANADDAFASRFQDWRRWITEGILDAVAPMAYTPDNEAFEGYIRSAVDVAGRDRVWAGIGAYQNTYDGTVDKLHIANDMGVRGVVLFSYDWAVSEGPSAGGRTFLERVGAEAFRH